MSRILAIDAGYVCLGWAVLEGGQVIDCGTIRTAPSPKKRKVRAADDHARRCQEQAAALETVIDNHKPALAVVEIPHGGAQSAKSMAALASATAIVASVLSLKMVLAEWTTPNAGKLAMCGNAKASKDEMVQRAGRLFPVVATLSRKADREAVADALAAYLAARGGALVRMVEQMGEVR